MDKQQLFPLCLELDEKAHYMLTKLAEEHFRKPSQMLHILVWEGLGCYQFEHDICPEKRPEDCDPDKDYKQFYASEEVIEALRPRIG